MKYPPSFKAQASAADDAFISLVDGNAHISIRARKNYQASNITKTMRDAVKIENGQYSGYKYFYREGIGYSGSALIQLGQNALEFSYDIIGANDQSISQESLVENNLDQILSTFKFIK